MLKIKLYYPAFKALAPQLEPATILYTEPKTGVTPFSVWASLVGEPMRVFVCYQDTMPDNFAADFPTALRAESIAFT